VCKLLYQAQHPGPHVSRLQTIPHSDVGIILRSGTEGDRLTSCKRVSTGIGDRGPFDRDPTTSASSRPPHLDRELRQIGPDSRTDPKGVSSHWPRLGFGLERRSGLFPRTLASRHRPIDRAPEPVVRTCGSSRTMQDYRRDNFSGRTSSARTVPARTDMHASVG